MKFVGRQQEMRELAEMEALSKKKLFIAALYGLRRIGKTRLLLEYVKERGIYFFVNKNKTSNDLLGEFSQILREHGTITGLETLNSWDNFVEAITTRQHPPIIFDEFQNFKLVEPAIFGILQKNIDLNENKPGMIIFSGSLIGLMKKLFRDSKEPLYGRIKKGMKLEPLPLAASMQLASELQLGKEEFLKLYCLFGGYPKYYVALEDFSLQRQNAEKILDALLLSKGAPLEDEAGSILSAEFGARSGTYYSILEAIASGNNTLSSIACYLNLQPTSITRQINELKDYFELIEFEMPYAGKRGIYKIKHPLMNFWFSQIYKNFSDYAARKPAFLNALKENMNSFYGKAFENAAKELLVRELKLEEAKRQWGKVQKGEKGKNAYEIDLIGKNGESSFAFEFKFATLERAQAIGILKNLQGKAVHVHGLPSELKFGLVALKIREKQKLRSAGYLAYDIDDF